MKDLNFNLTVNHVEILLTGRFCLYNLAVVGFKRDGRAWVFNGHYHHYEFESHKDELIIRITPRPGKEAFLIPSTTFGQIDSWVLKCLEVITIRGKYYG